MNGHVGFRQKISVVELTCLCAVSVDSFYGTSGKQGWNVRRDNIFDGSVGGTDDCAACNDIPDGDAVREQQFLFFRDRNREGAVRQSGQDFPEPVLRMTVIELLFSGFYGRERAQDQDTGILIKYRCESMGVGFVF